MISSIGPMLRTSLFVADLGPRKRDAALLEMARRAGAHGAVRDPDVVLRALLLRERLGPTALGRGLAVPNARSIASIEPALIAARSRRGIEWGAPDGEPVHLVLALLVPPEVPAAQFLEWLGQIAGAARPARARAKLMEAPAAAAAALLRELIP